MINKNISSSIILSTFLVLTIGCGGGSGSDKVSTSPPKNIAPTANAGSDQAVDEEIIVNLLGNGNDPDGSITTYQWKQLSGPNVVLDNHLNQSTFFSAPTLITASTLSFELTVTDNLGLTASDEVNIIVNPINELPSVNAGIDRSVDENTLVILSATAEDSDGSIMSLKWSQIAGGVVTLNDSTNASTSFTAPYVNNNNIFEFQLTITDNEGGLASDTVMIEIKNTDASFGVNDPLFTLPKVDGYGVVSDIVSLDLNFDNLQDLILISTTDKKPEYTGVNIQALINNGDGTFSDKSNFYFPDIGGSKWKWLEKIYVVDLNNDGLEDIVGHADGAENIIPPMMRKLDGSFSQLSDPLLLEGLGGYIPIDIDKDGDYDLLRRVISYDPINEQKHEIMLLENITGPDKLLKLKPITQPINDNKLVGIDNSSFIYAPVVVDINNDGFDDLIMTGPKWKDGFVDERAPVYAFINSGKNTLIESTSITFPDGIPSFTHARELAIADIDKSGNQSIIIANHGYDAPPYSGENNSVLRNLGNGTFIEDIGDSTNFNYEGFTHSTTSGDIDNDGDIDIIFAEYYGASFSGANSIRILENDGNGNFTKRFFTQTRDLNTNFAWTSSLLVDLNNDKFPELVLGMGGDPTRSQIFWNDGKGYFKIEEL
ncbi:FG-GAP-like repeat-containing protein [Pseudoalteromonas tunicata]|uniref:FG-GAP repeat domain-containing protein n=1 Tax=Pseudoalteromonas tunicata TaxID=314281 RepID=UPI00273E59E8|nr:FG-GAP-like repeat-containing protein [Pseudoalteromonas tunicata]MDP5213462.1 FG-GAP-like repeat-containing protein [Pseudoalteromonas tunicata]